MNKYPSIRYHILNDRILNVHIFNMYIFNVIFCDVGTTPTKCNISTLTHRELSYQASKVVIYLYHKSHTFTGYLALKLSSRYDGTSSRSD